MMMRYWISFVLLLLLGVSHVQADPFGPYNNTTGGAIPDSSCGAGTELVRSFNVTDDFTVNEIDVGFNATHPFRSVIQLQLRAPDGTTVTIKTANGGAGGTNYDITLDDASANDPNTGAGGANNTAAPFYDVTVGPLPDGALDTSFDGISALGTWDLIICDIDGFGDNGQFNRARLNFDGTPTAPPAAITGLSKSFSPASISIGETSTITYTVENTTANPVSGVSITDNLTNAIWVDSTALGGTCNNFTLGTALGDSTISLTGGDVPANGSCTVTVQVRSNVLGTHNSNATSGAFSAGAGLTVTDFDTVVCTPGNLGAGSINFSDGDELFSVNLATGKAQPITTVPAANVPSGIINSVAVDPRNYIIYYMDNTGANGNASIFGYDIIADSHFTVVNNVTTQLGMTLGNRGLGSGGASYYGGALYVAIEDRGGASEEVVFRLQLASNGRTVDYASEIVVLPPTEFGDIVVTGDDLLVFDAGNSNYGRYDLETLTQQATAGPNAAYSQGGAQRDGSTLWAVSNVLQQININNGALSGASIPVTTDGVNAISAADSGGCVPATNRIGDLVWNDADGDGIKDNEEVGIGGVTLDLFYDVNGDGALTAADDITGDNAITAADRADTTTTSADGSYFFDNLIPEDYVVRVTDTGGVLSGAAITTGSIDQAATDVIFNEDRQGLDFGYQLFIQVIGDVFVDNGVNTAIAHDSLFQADERGLDTITVQATDPNNGDAVIVSAVTDGNGRYQLNIPFGFAGNLVDIRVQQPGGVRAISENLGNTASSDTDFRDNQIQFTPAANISYTNVNFGYVANVIFTPDNTGTNQAGQFILYSHEFIGQTTGEVTFSSTGISTPSSAGWNNVLYRDDNCDDVLDPSELTPLSGSISINATESICIFNRVFAASNVNINSQYTVSITASIAYTGETPDGLVDERVSVDVTTLANPEITLSKTVENISLTETPSTSNAALPGHVLRYVVTFQNLGTSAVSDFVIYDLTPAFTTLNTAVLCPVTLPASLTGCSVTAPSVNGTGNIQWTFTGQLDPNQQGSVTFDVLVD